MGAIRFPRRGWMSRPECRESGREAARPFPADTRVGEGGGLMPPGLWGILVRMKAWGVIVPVDGA